jgi:pimeloyl-ACP methyl ester carboxylesterase
VLSTQYASEKTANEVISKARVLATELNGKRIENVLICDNGVSRNSIYHDAVHLKSVIDGLNENGRKVIVVGYSRGGSVALFAERLGAKMAGLVTIESPILGAPKWVLKILGFNLAYQGVQDMAKGSESNLDLLNAIKRGPQLPKMLEITGLVGRTIASKHALNIFSPIGKNVYLINGFIHMGQGWLHPDAVCAIAKFVHSFES